jgi:hypothetical protein
MLLINPEPYAAVTMLFDSAATTATPLARTAVTEAQDQNTLTKNPQGGTHSTFQAESSQFGTLSHPSSVPQTGASPMEAISSLP